MVSDKFKSVFVHIPKTAGQSIERAFLSLHNLTWEQRSPLLLRYNPVPALGPERLAHLTAEEYTRIGYMKEDEFNQFFKFSFVRNPWDRLVSEFKYRHYDSRYSFKDFVSNGLPEKNLYLDSYRHIIPQSNYLYNEHGDLIVDFVGRFEHLQSDFNQICERLNLPEIALPHVNSSKNNKQNKKNSSFRDYYDQETVEIVSELYKTDVSLFNYSF